MCSSPLSHSLLTVEIARGNKISLKMSVRIFRLEHTTYGKLLMKTYETQDRQYAASPAAALAITGTLRPTLVQFLSSH